MKGDPTGPKTLSDRFRRARNHTRRKKARGATIELRRPWQRAVFIDGLFGTLIVAYLTLMFAG
ncbi:MAG: hypothetical protein K2Y27_33355 [Xanthobacteraceae bacterium]|nr:hypothetical protein [Xanthobacteraceae bacterium]